MTALQGAATWTWRTAVVVVVTFLSRSAMLERDFAVGGVSVCLSHAGNASKLRNLGCGYHRPVTQELVF